MVQSQFSTADKIAGELKVEAGQVKAAINLLDDGATVPFIARYRKEVTRGLDDVQLRYLADRLIYLRDLDARKQTALQAITEQEKLTPTLEQAIQQADTKTRLEDLYAPYRIKRKTKASAAKEAGLGPLADALLQKKSQHPETLAKDYMNQENGIADESAALEGAKQILMEQFAEDAELLKTCRSYLWRQGVLKAEQAKQEAKKDSKFKDYYDYDEPIKRIPSHRALALFRGRREGELKLALLTPDEPDFGEKTICKHFKLEGESNPGDKWLQEVAKATWQIKLKNKLEVELLAELRERADEEATKVFASNLRDLLLASPAGAKVTLGLDPGIRTGVKAVVVDGTGKVLEWATLYPFKPQNQWHESIATLAKIAVKYNVELISIGNGTASGETERLVADLAKMYPDIGFQKVIVSEAGASVYSASELASKELTDLDVSLRGAASIARRLQDPLAELVKIEPKAIGVGQYQHDVNQTKLGRGLEAVVEDCVNAVGVDVNMASPALLNRVSGLGETVAQNLVAYRDQHGAFINREQLKNIPRMGEKVFQQSAGFLRINHGENPLDRSAVHPEAYPLVEKILNTVKLSLQEIMGNKDALNALNPQDFVDETYGLPTVTDVLCELNKPGRDPRPEFKIARFKEGIEDITHLTVGMILEGVVSNVTNFGAFVDVGVHQDGLVHISALTDRFVKDPRSVVKAGQIVTVKVTEVDKDRKRISLSMRLDEDAKEIKDASKKPQPKLASSKKIKRKAVDKKTQSANNKKKTKPLFNTAMADALSKLKRETK